MYIYIYIYKLCCFHDLFLRTGTLIVSFPCSHHTHLSLWAGSLCRADGRRFEGVFVDDYPTVGTYTDERGARFAVEMLAKTLFSEVVGLGDGAFRSKTLS